MAPSTLLFFLLALVIRAEHLDAATAKLQELQATGFYSEFNSAVSIQIFI